MSQAKTERLVNLTIALMATPRLLTVTELGRLIEGYEPDDTETGGDAFRRMFERDKEELRELGIPLQTGTVDPLHGDEIGYRIPRSDYALPDITLDPDEAAALGLAARLWSSAHLAAAADSALRKLAAAGVEPRAAPGLEARVEASEPAFEPMFDAVSARQVITFDYRRPSAEPMTRHLQPWGLVSWHGRWYVGGHDLDRNSPRVFRLSRVVGDVTSTGQPHAYEIPAGVDVRAMVTDVFGTDVRPARTATIRLAPGAAHHLRREGTSAGSDPDLLEVQFRSVHGLAEVVAGYGPDAIVLEPADLRTEVIGLLRALIGEPA